MLKIILKIENKNHESIIGEKNQYAAHIEYFNKISIFIKKIIKK